MNGKRPLTPDEISAIVDGIKPIDWDEMEMLAKLSLGKRILIPLFKTEMLRSYL
jgi:hypothetical protein